MPNALIFNYGDIGYSFRLLQHAKSFSSIPESHVYIVGCDDHSLPRDIENAPNITFMPIFIFRPFPYLSFFLFPIRIILSIIQIFFISISITSIDFIFSSTENLLINIICCYIICIFKKSKLIIDISPFKWMNPKRFYQIFFKLIETNQFKVADLCIVSTQAMQIILKVRKIKSILIRDFPGNFFTQKNESKNKIRKNIKISENSLLITIPLNKEYKDEHYFLNYLEDAGQLLNRNEIKTTFCIFGSFKNNFFNEFSKKLNNFSDKKLKFVEFRFYPINSYQYSSIVRASDFGIVFEGSKFGLDITSELNQIAACDLPIIVYKYGCVCELFRESNFAFFFTNKEEFIEIFQKNFIQKKVDFDNQKICTSKQFNWTEVWNNTILKFINSI